MPGDEVFCMTLYKYQAQVGIAEMPELLYYLGSEPYISQMVIDSCLRYRAAIGYVS